MADDYTSGRRRHFMSMADSDRINEILAKVAEQKDPTDVDRLTLAVDKLADRINRLAEATENRERDEQES